MLTFFLHLFSKLGLVMLLAVMLLGGTLAALPARADGPLPNGAAAGDITQTAAILWTRATTVGQVSFAYGTDPDLSGALTTTTTVTEVYLPVKAVITGLTSATTYYYAVTDTLNFTATGQFRTPAMPSTRHGLRFGVSGDWSGSLAPYPAISNVEERNLDFFVELGDTAYADQSSPIGSAANTLAEFRLKHHEVYSTHLGLNSWADVRAATAVLATIDDHEVSDDFAGGADVTSDSNFTDTSGLINDAYLYEIGVQAFQEYNPLRNEFYGNTGDSVTAYERKLYRYNTYGSDAAAFVLDTRSFRDEEVDPPASANPSDILAFLNNTYAAGRTLLGAQQLADLKADLLQAQSDGLTWKFIFISGPIQNLGLGKAEDRYEGYAVERKELLKFIADNSIDNVVFVAASLHGTLVNNLAYRSSAFAADVDTDAFEIIVGPTAVTPTFGPATVALGQAVGLIDSSEKADYDSRDRDGKDQFVKDFVDDELLDVFSLSYDRIGLTGSTIDAELLVGDYVAVHTFGWTEFEIGSDTQALTVTTYGIDSYDETDLANNSANVITRTPTIVSQFVVTAQNVVTRVNAVAITGPVTGITSNSYVFTATVSPGSATTPITYTWQATDQSQTVSQTFSVNNSLTLSWAITGTKHITVTANNGGSPVTATHTFTITEKCPAGSVSYVHRTATGNNDGSDWNDAFTHLQDALNTTYLTNCNIDEIWVAEGTYYPDLGADQIADSVTATFQLIDGVEIYGGFVATETQRTERDWGTNVTILSGDIDGDNITDGDNSWHVVTASSLTSAVLDGFTITRGKGGGTNSTDDGGGLLANGNSTLALTNLVFSNNNADRGGGLYANTGQLALNNVTFQDNNGTEAGGMFVTSNTESTIKNSYFLANSNGGLDNMGAVTLTNVIVLGNDSGSNAGLRNRGSGRIVGYKQQF